jgi:long-chain acyl-CoA synthetase
MNLADWLVRRARMSPQRAALFEGTRAVADYAQFHRDAATVAGWLQGQGIRPGDRVAIFMKNVPEYLVVFYAIWLAGGVVVPINAKLHAREVAYILDNAGVSLVFASGGLDGALAEAGIKQPVITTPGAAFADVLQAAPIVEMVHRAR